VRKMGKTLSLIVLVKQVPEIEKVRFDYEKGRLDRSSAGAVINPFDLNALEVAVRVKEKTDAVVTAISMGPKQAGESLRDAIARGADKGVLLADEKFAGADTLATSNALASAIRKLGSFDLVVCGEKTIDGDTAQVGPEVAELLAIPCAAYVEEILEVHRSRIVVKSKMGKNYHISEVTFPALITVTKDVNTPRLPSLRDKLRSRKIEVTTWGAEDLSAVAQMRCFGLSGSPTWVARIYAPPSRRRGPRIIEGTAEEKARTLAKALRNLNVLR